MLAADPALVGNIDAFALHPYGTTATDAAEWVIDFRSVLDHLHEGSVPIDITEFGWLTGTTASDEDWRAAQMNALGLAFARSDCGLRELAPYDWVNPTALAEPGDFGFVDAGAQATSPRPAASSWNAALARRRHAAVATAGRRHRRRRRPAPPTARPACRRPLRPGQRGAAGRRSGDGNAALRRPGERGAAGRRAGKQTAARLIAPPGERAVARRRPSPATVTVRRPAVASPLGIGTAHRGVHPPSP